MSIRFGGPENIGEVISTIRENDKLFYKIFILLFNGQDKDAYMLIREKFGYSLMDSRLVIHRIQNIYNEKQITNLLKAIIEENPEYAIWI